MSNLVCVGQIVNVHGIKGAVKIKPFLSNPVSIGTFGSLTDTGGQRIFDLQSCQVHGDTVIAFLKGVTDRTAAESLKGIKLYVSRSVLPKAEANEFYCYDLVGLSVFDGADLYGTVKSVENYGAGDILEIRKTNGKDVDFSFTAETFPNVDIAAGKIEINLPLDVNGDSDED